MAKKVKKQIYPYMATTVEYRTGNQIKSKCKARRDKQDPPLKKKLIFLLQWLDKTSLKKMYQICLKCIVRNLQSMLQQGSAVENSVKRTLIKMAFNEKAIDTASYRIQM